MKATRFLFFALAFPLGHLLGAADPTPAPKDAASLADAETLQGNFAKAEAILKAEVTRCEGLKSGQMDLADALGRLGQVQLLWRKNADALENTKKALVIVKAHRGEKHGYVYSLKLTTGEIYTALGRFKEAETWYADCFHNYAVPSRDPGELLRLVADLYLSAGRHDDALSSCTRAIDLLTLGKPIRALELSTANRTLGKIYLAKSDPRRAKACFDGIKGPVHLTTMNQELGMYYLAAGEHSEAIKRFLGEIETFSKNREEFAPEIAEATYWLGRAQVASGDKAGGRKSLAEALAFYEKQPQMDPNFVGRILEVYVEHFPDLMDARLKAKRDEIRAFRDANKPAGYAKTFATPK